MFIHTLILLLLASSSYCEIKCVKQPECDCLDGDYLEYQCPNLQAIIHVYKQKKIVQVDCSSSSPMKESDLPVIDVGDQQRLDFSGCGLPETNYISILRKMNVTKISELTIDESTFNSQNTLNFSKDALQGMEYIESLKIRSVKQLQIEDDVLEAVPNLKEFTLHFSNISNRININFSFVKNLTYLEMSAVELQEIPLKEDDYLPRLKRIYLYNNNIKTLETNAFRGAVNLELLELSKNQIQFIDGNIFQKMNNLYILSLFSNNLSEITEDTFKYTKHLSNLRLEYNPMLKLHDYAFANMTNLTKIFLNNCNLQELPPNLFDGSTNLEHVSLNDNQLSIIPDNFFDELTKIKTLSLDHNKIKYLPEDMFNNLEALEELYLGHNSLTVISAKLFNKQSNLLKLNLRFNQIEKIEGPLLTNTKLQDLDLSNNKISTLVTDSVIELNLLNNLKDLQYLNLSRNLLESEAIPTTMVKIERVDLSFNRIKNISLLTLSNINKQTFAVDLANNEISRIDSTIYTTSDEDRQEITLSLINNPIDCDCYNYDFIKNYPDVRNVNKIFYIENYEQLKCTSGIPLVDIARHLDIINCPMNELLPQDYKCTKGCGCFWKPFNSTFAMDCSNRNLTQIPTFVAPLNCSIWNRIYRTKNIEINLSNNLLDVPPSSQNGYEDVTELNLSNNKLGKFNWAPPHIQKLYLDHNHLSTINDNVLDQLNGTMKYLTLDGNPWTCDCSTLKLQDFLIHNNKQIGDTNIYCKDTSVKIIQNSELCDYTTTIVLATAPIVVIILFIACGAAMYYKWQEEIKVWLYSKNLCLWWVTEEELDKNKLYDAFLSFSHKDDEFVLKSLLPFLESDTNAYKLCVHYRDFVVGAHIGEQITSTIANSRRTIVVLSENFLESCWAKMEFRTAHLTGISEGRSRVIIIVYGDLDESKLPGEIKAYLRTNTYVKWGDPWFWQKLTYAMPHKKTVKFNQKHANVMLNLDNKFELKNPKVAQSTPPILNDNSKILSSFPIAFIEDKVEPTSPTNSDTPLIV